MLYRTLYCLALMMFLVSSAYAQNNWTNGTGNGLWTDPNNWSAGAVPGPGTGNTRINPDTNADPNNPVGPTIGPGDLAMSDAMDVWGPEFGAISVNIEGGSYTSPAWIGMVSVSDNPIAGPSINVGQDGSGGWLDVINFLVGHTWWYTDGPYTTYNQWSGTATVRDSLWLGGRMNLYGGIMYVFNGAVLATDVHPPDICTLNIAGGTLMLPLLATADDPNTTDVDESVSYTNVVQDWIDNGYCVAYGGKGDIVIEEIDGWTKITALPYSNMVTVEFSGVVGGGSFIVPEELSGVIKEGDPVNGSFTIAVDASDSNPDPNYGDYRYDGHPYSMKATFGDAHIDADEFRIQVLDNYPIGIYPNGVDRLGVISLERSALKPSDIIPGQFHIFFTDPTQSVFKRDAIPQLPLDLGLFTKASGQVATLTGVEPKVFFNFSITQMNVLEHSQDR